jgi:cathepsin H
MVYCVNSAFMMYKGGIFSDETCCQTKQGLHAVSIVGFNLDNNPPYFLVRNSWGANWGEQGYFRIKISEKAGLGICDMYMKSSNVTF